jgi:hypothetical protein
MTPMYCRRRSQMLHEVLLRNRRGFRATGAGFSALGNYATYYLVSYRFTGDLRNGSRNATCTYRRDGQWVRDDAAAYKLRGELEAARPGKTAFPNAAR